MRWMLWIFTVALVVGVVGCGDDTPSKPAKPADVTPETVPPGPPSSGPSKTTIRIMTPGLSDHAAAAVLEGAQKYFTEQKRNWVVVLQPALPAFTDDDAVNAIIVFGDPANAPKLAPKAKYTPIIFLEPTAAPPQNTFSIKTDTGAGSATLTLNGLTPDVVEKIRSGQIASVIIPNYGELGHRAAEVAHNAIKREGDLKGSPVSPNETVPLFLVDKSNIDDPKVKALLP